MQAYAILGLTPSATRDEVKRAFHKLAHKHHPDKGGNAETFKKISAAYAEVKDLEPQPTTRLHNFSNGATVQYGNVYVTVTYN